MPLEQRYVPKIGLPGEVEEISEYRNCAESRVERHITRHAQQCGARGAHAKRFDEYPRRQNGANGIAQAGDEAEDGIETKANAGAGYGDSGIQPSRKPTEVSEASLRAYRIMVYSRPAALD